MGEPTNDSPTHMASSRVEAGSGRWQVGVGTLGRGVVVVVVVMGMGMVMVVTVVVVRRAVIVCRLRRAVVVDETVVVDGLGRVFHRPAGLGLGQHRAKGTPGLGRDPGGIVELGLDPSRPDLDSNREVADLDLTHGARLGPTVHRHSSHPEGPGLSDQRGPDRSQHGDVAQRADHMGGAPLLPGDRGDPGVGRSGP